MNNNTIKILIKRVASPLYMNIISMLGEKGIMKLKIHITEKSINIRIKKNFLLVIFFSSNILPIMIIKKTNDDTKSK